MAISFVGSASGFASDGGDVTITLPAGIQENDLVIVGYSIGDGDNVDFDMALLTSGYTKVADLFSDDTNDTNLGVFWKVMGATPDTSVVCDGQGGLNASVAGVCMVFRGVDTTTPMDVTPTTSTGINTFNPNPPAISWVTSGSWTVIVGANGHSRGSTGTYTFPTGYTTNALSRGADDNYDTTIGIGYNPNPALPEDPGVMIHSGTDNGMFSWCAVTLALRPASGSAPVELRTLSLLGVGV
ncbi:MAG: hypothetical protein ABIL14_01445 [candidate division WOR-3 bacterium]